MARSASKTRMPTAAEKAARWQAKVDDWVGSAVVGQGRPVNARDMNTTGMKRRVIATPEDTACSFVAYEPRREVKSVAGGGGGPVGARSLAAQRDMARAAAKLDLKAREKERADTLKRMMKACRAAEAKRHNVAARKAAGKA